MGCYGERVTDPQKIKPALERALKSGKPAVIDVVVDKEPYHKTSRYLHPYS